MCTLVSLSFPAELLYALHCLHGLSDHEGAFLNKNPANLLELKSKFKFEPCNLLFSLNLSLKLTIPEFPHLSFSFEIINFGNSFSFILLVN